MITKTLNWCGRTLEIEFNYLAQEAHSSVLVNYYASDIHAPVESSSINRSAISVLAALCIDEVSTKENFLPLSVHYQEKAFAVGKIPGGFIKREGRPSDKEVTISRLIDRSLRPLFSKFYNQEIQLICTLLNHDQEHDADVVALVASFACIYLSKIVEAEPLGCIKLGLKNGWLFNPSIGDQQGSFLDLIVVGQGNGLIMLEGSSNEVDYEILFDGIKNAMEQYAPVIELLRQIRVEYLDILNHNLKINCGKTNNLADYLGQMLPNKLRVMRFLSNPVLNLAKKNYGDFVLILKKVEAKFGKKLSNHIKTLWDVCHGEGKKASDKPMDSQIQEILSLTCTNFDSSFNLYCLQSLWDEIQVFFDKNNSNIYLKAHMVLRELIDRILLEYMLKKRVRLDGRDFSSIRPVEIISSWLKNTHGSCLFTRGQTQVLAALTLGSSSDEQTLDLIDGERREHFLLHYNFPSYAVNEVDRMGSTARREIGHGNLIYKSLLPILPSKKNFNHTIRIVNEVLGANGSSSMASICASSLALASARVPISRLVAGVTLGMLKSEQGDLIVDILSQEDNFGILDFKISGSNLGICSIQMDIKPCYDFEKLSYSSCLDLDNLRKVFIKAQEALTYLLELMDEHLQNHKPMFHTQLPQLLDFYIPRDRIRDIIGVGGKIIKQICEKFNCKIDITEEGFVSIKGSQVNTLAARDYVNYLLKPQGLQPETTCKVTLERLNIFFNYRDVTAQPLSDDEIIANMDTGQELAREISAECSKENPTDHSEEKEDQPREIINKNKVSNLILINLKFSYKDFTLKTKLTISKDEFYNNLNSIFNLNAQNLGNKPLNRDHIIYKLMEVVALQPQNFDPQNEDWLIPYLQKFALDLKNYLLNQSIKVRVLSEIDENNYRAKLISFK